MDVEQERLRLRSEIAGLRVLAALVRWEVKYRDDQTRNPATGRGGVGGRFADEGRGSAGRKRSAAFAPPVAAAAARIAARAAPAMASAGAAEAAAIAGPGIAALMVGGIGVSRAAGLAAVASGAADGMTPILGIPFKLDMPGRSIAVRRLSRPAISARLRNQCDEAYDDEVTECYQAHGLKRYTFNPGNRSLQQCLERATLRLADCYTKGGPGRPQIVLFPSVPKRSGK